MNEEQNNNEQNSTTNDIQDTKSTLKDGANFAKNASTGNIFGAVKDGFKFLGNKKVRNTIIIAILIPIIVIVALASSLYVIYDEIGKVIQEAINGIVSFFDVNWSDEEDQDDSSIKNGVIKVDDNTIDMIIKAIESTGVDLEDLKLMGDIDYSIVDKESKEYKNILRKYIRKFYEAQAVTETLNTKPGWFEEYVLNGGEMYGSVYVYRVQDGNTDNVVQLKYMPYSKMKESAENEEIAAIKSFFSINDNKLVIPEWTMSHIEGENAVTTVSLREIDYKNLISQYTTPMNFFLYLAMISQNPKFVSAVADLVKGSEIHLTILDTTTINTTEEVYTYTTNTKGSSVSYKKEFDNEGNFVGTKKKVTEIDETKDEKETKTTKIKTVTPTLKVTHVKTWFCEQDITYVKKEVEPYHDSYVIDSNTDESLADDQEPDDPPEGKTVSWITNRKKDITVDNTGTTYEEYLRGEVEDKTDDFIKLLDTKYKIPNSNRYEAAGKNNMISGAEWLFSLMQNDPGLQTLEQIMRYIMYKYTGDDKYGVTDFDFSIFNAKDFSSVSSANSLKAFLHHFEGTKESNRKISCI